MDAAISYNSLLLTILTGAAVATMVYLIIVLVRLNRAAAQLDGVLGRADDLLVSLKTLAEESTETVIAARQLIDEGANVATDLAALSARVRGLTDEDTGHVASLFSRVKSALAIVAGVKTAYATLKHFLWNRRQPATDQD